MNKRERMKKRVEDWELGIRRKAPKRADETVEHRSAAKAGELERQRNRSADLRLKLHVVKSRLQAFYPGRGRVSKGNTRFVAPHQDSFYPHGAADDPQLSERKHGFRRRRNRTEPVPQLGSQRLDFGGLLEAGEALVDVDLGLLRHDVFVGQVIRR